MAPIFYRKLVRDRIPEIIEDEGKKAVKNTLQKAEREYFLRLKLLEEAHELFKARDSGEFVKEAADVFEVIMALAEHHSVSMASIEEVRAKRARARGAFKDSVYLHAVYAADEKLPDNVSNTGFLLNPFVVSNSSSPTIIEVLRQELAESIECSIASAFLTRGLINLLKRPIEEFLARGGKLSLLTSIMNDFNNPEDLLHIKATHPSLQLKIFYPLENSGEKGFTDAPPPFHLKCFLFTKQDARNSLIIGSSNMTAGGLLNNEEWNFFSNSEVNLPFASNDERSVFQIAQQNYQNYWENSSLEPGEEFMAFYRKRFERHNQMRRELQQAMTDEEKPSATCRPRPRPSQREALAGLAERRNNGVKRTAVIAATGLGKTHLAAFDFLQSGFKSVLFLVHRANILVKARETFRQVLGDNSFGELLTGDTPVADRKRMAETSRGIFAMVQTLSQPSLLELFSKQHFDYIVFDEFHHGYAPTYKRVLEYFESRFFLGLTATPERLDGRDVLELCDYDIAYEMRLFKAIDQKWLTPFQYYAIYDPTDYNQIRWTGTGYDEQQLEAALSSDTRAEIIINNLKAYLPAFGSRIRALAFCSNKGHARYMTEAFKRAGLAAECLLGESSDAEREKTISRLQSENDALQIICSVDILGEGIDIPAVSHVLLLRPTESPTVVLQQLGRGLRVVPGKDFLVVLDFVGNFKNSHIIPSIFSGHYFSTDEKPLKAPVSFVLPNGCSADVDTRVTRIWEDEIRKKLCLKPEEILKEAYLAIKGRLGRSPTLLDFIANRESEDSGDLVKILKKWLQNRKAVDKAKNLPTFVNWLRAKEMVDDLSLYEKNLLGTLGEEFLQHIENDLSPKKSYKMVVLKVLLADKNERTAWPIDWIAEGFRNYYLSHPAHLGDCSLLEDEEQPEKVSFKKFVTLVKGMPLDKLSNSPDKYFELDAARGSFELKEAIRDFWSQPDFRRLVLERADYALALYFRRPTNQSKSDRKAPPGIVEKVENFAPEPLPKTVDAGEDTIELPFYYDLKVAAGRLNQTFSAEKHSEAMAVPKTGNYSPDRHFVVKISGNSMNGGKSPIKDGDLVILEKITATSAGSLNGQIAAVEYHDEYGSTAYALKKIKKTGNQYFLVSNNKDFKEVLIDPAQIKPFARYIKSLK
ncbi:MAG: DEAD/DEAH box helicase family protein [Candidatus Riflebacteria bacterium]|nr:DEAD/DEAH box helicase family protein [Candidatus Riflebacteria bacterium]